MGLIPGNRNSRRRTLLAMAATVILAPLPAAADSFSYENAFERRVAGSGSRDALDAFVVESVKQGQYDQAISTLEEVLFTAPNDIDARLALVRLFYQLGSFDLAAAHLDQVLLVNSTGYEADIARLQKLVARSQRGVDARMAVTVGGAYNHSTLTLPSVPSTSTDSVFTPFVIIDGEIVRQLDTASRDELRFGGSLQYERSLTDSDFNGTLDPYDNFGLRGEATYSKGLPGIIDTLRFDVSGYGLVQGYGGGRQLQEFGTEAELSVQPTVESRLRAFAGYGWLGNSTGLFSNDRVRYGVAGEVRVAPTVAIGAQIAGYQEHGTAPVAFAGGGTGFTAHGYAISGSVSHLLYIFDDGRSWVHQAGGSYSEERVLDYASIAGPFPFLADMADRKAWEVYWNHTVQIATQAEFNFRISYGQEKISDTVPFLTTDRDNKFWGIKTGLTYRFN
jgi:Tetratricopeptide repeat